jgi:hypothetical protein
MSIHPNVIQACKPPMWRGACLGVWLLLFALAPYLCFTVAADEQVDYLRQIKPLLRERCYACHGALKQEGGLRLDTAHLALKGGDSGAVLTPENPLKSLLLNRITATDPSEHMPPPQEGEALTAEQVRLLQHWIADGAQGPEDEQPETDPGQHWAFQPIARPTVPKTDTTWVRNPIDAFLHQRQTERGIQPQPEAQRIVLLRRLYFDLIGIPPTLEEIAACEADASPQWYEHTLERLLDDPRHGERWARHWMDIWRYSDWWGLGAQLRNSQKHIWHWRDWIVESLNADTPYDEMVRLMLAADELYPNDLSKLRATGFLARNYWLFNRPQWMEETVEHVSKGFLGLTMNCARCHDHKYDPLAQNDYYRLRAFFEPYHVRLDMVPGETDLAQNGIPRAFDGLPEEPTYLYIRGDERNPDKSTVITPGVPALLSWGELTIEPVPLPTEAYQPARRPWVLDAYISAAKQRVEAAEAELKKSQAKVVTDIPPAETPKTPSPPLAPTVPSQQPDLSSEDDAHALELAEKTATEARGKQKIAEAAVELARAELESVERRAEAQRAEWNPQESNPQEKVAIAVRAERRLSLAQAQHNLAVSERALQRAAADKREAAEKSQQEALNALEKAQQVSAAEILSTDCYTPFSGAMWTPTRFFNSAKDDPEVNFHPQSTGRRTALANWITDRRNPLTARVAVNQIWTRHMGQPLVPTLFDFGRKGTPPTQPELLDWLASELIDSGWSMKHVHRLIVSSAAYRLSSSLAANEVAVQRDPENQLWWRREPTRMESQLVRDSLLALAGTLDLTRGGPSVPAGQQDNSTRRSLYFFHSNNERNLFLTTFDEALVKDCYRREQSIVPQQALALSNSQLALDAAEKIALRLSENQPNETAFIRTAFRFITGINPNHNEIAASEVAWEAWKKLPGGNDQLARTNLVWALINHNDFVTLR